MAQIPPEMMKKLLRVVDGTPGALSVITQIMAYPNFPTMLDYLDEHGPHGSDLWVWYKDGCGEDITKFYKKLIAKM